jgi:hypothetical protein
VHGFLQWQESAEHQQEVSAKRAAAGRKGGQRKQSAKQSAKQNRGEEKRREGGVREAGDSGSVPAPAEPPPPATSSNDDEQRLRFPDKCPKHQQAGYVDEPCRACGDARRRHQQQQGQQAAEEEHAEAARQARADAVQQMRGHEPYWLRYPPDAERHCGVDTGGKLVGPPRVVIQAWQQDVREWRDEQLPRYLADPAAWMADARARGYELDRDDALQGHALAALQQWKREKKRAA